MLLDAIHSPADLRPLSYEQLGTLATEIRDFIVHATSVTGGHLGSNLGIVELTLAVHRVFDSPHDIVLFDTGHQAYVHKIVTGRADLFPTLRQAGGLSGYPNRSESPHDWVENSHASTILSYAHGLAESVRAGPHDPEAPRRHVVAVIGDGSMTGGLAYEALNNLGHANSRVLIIVNDNGRSYAPTVSKLSRNVSRIRLSRRYVRAKKLSEAMIGDLPVVGRLGRRTVSGLKAALREIVDEPHAFYESLGVRYVGPIDGHDQAELEHALRGGADYEGAIVMHVLTRKGFGYSFAEDDDEKHLHDVGTFDPIAGPAANTGPRSYTDAFTDAMVLAGANDRRVHAITAAMPGPTGLLAFQARFPDRFHDVGIAEQHAVTMAAGMAMGGLRPVVAVYSTFLTRAVDQTFFDVGLHRLPVIFAIDRAGITGPDGPSHHGLLDLALLTKVPGMTVLAPSSAQEVSVMLHDALTITDGPVAIRYPRGSVRDVPPDQVGSGLKARLVRDARTAGDSPDVCLIGIGKLVEPAEEAAAALYADKGISVTVWDARCVKPLDPQMIIDAARHRLVVTVEDGVREGGAGAAIADAVASVHGIGHRTPPVVVIGTPVVYIPQGTPGQIHANLGLDAVGIATTIAQAYKAATE